MKNLEAVISAYKPLVESKHPGRGDVACAIVTKHWDAQAERDGYRGMSGAPAPITANTVLLVLKDLAMRKPEFAAELKAAR